MLKWAIQKIPKRLLKIVLCALRWLWYVIAVLVIVGAIGVNILRAEPAWMNRLVPVIDRWVTRVVAQPVKFGAIRIHWSGLSPSVELKNVVVLSATSHHTLLRIRKLSMRFNLYSNLTDWNMMPSHLQASGINLKMHANAKGHLDVVGGSKTFHLSDGMDWLLLQRDMSLSNVTVDYQASDKQSIHLNQLGLRVTSSGLKHRLALAFSFANAAQSHVLLISQFTAARWREAGKSLRAYLRLKNVSMTELKQFPKLRAFLVRKKARGVLQSELWFDVYHNKLEKVSGNLSLGRAGWQASSGESFHLQRISTQLFWQSRENAWQLLLPRLQLQGVDRIWPTHFLRLRYQPSNTVPYQLWLDHVSYNEVQHFYPKLTQTVPRLADWSINARLNQLVINANLKPMHVDMLSAQVNLQQAKSKHYQLSNILGDLLWKNNQGQLRINSSTADLKLSPYEADIPLQHVHALLHLQQKKQLWKLHVQKLALKAKALQVHGGVVLSWSKTAPVSINGQLNFADKDVSQLRDLLPHKVMSPGLQSWLAAAFRSGSVKDGVMQWQGVVNQFPYNKHKGKFSIAMQVQDIDLHVQDHWPDLQHLYGPLAFGANSMLIDGIHGTVSGNPLTQAHVVIANLSHPILQATGNIGGSLKNGLQYLSDTPLPVGKRLKNMQASGPLQLALKLRIPLYQDNPVANSQGTIQLHNAILNLPQWGLAINGITGPLRFKDSSVSAKRLKARLWHKPVIAKLATIDANKKTQHLFVGITGRADIDTVLKPIYPMAKSWLHGVTGYSADVDVYSSNHYATAFHVSSNLRGVVINMGELYLKPASAKRAFSLSASIPAKKPLRITMHYAKHAAAELLFESGGKQLGLQRGVVSFGSDALNLSEKPGLQINVTAPSVTVSDWYQFYQKHMQSSAQTSVQQLLREINIHAAVVNAYGYHFKKVHAQIMPEKNAWKARVVSQELAGDVMIHGDVSHVTKVQAKLDHWIVPQKLSSSHGSWNPAGVPALSLSIGKLIYAGNVYRKIDVQTVPVMFGLRIPKLQFDVLGCTLTAEGSWAEKAKQQFSTAQGNVQCKSFGQLLVYYNLTRSLLGGAGRLNFEGSWPGSPLDLSANNFAGDLNYKLTDGAIIGLDKKQLQELGLGKLLNLFSVSSIPRRLTGNFHDLSTLGYTFNTMDGALSLQHGLGHLSHTDLNGPVARILAQGELNFRKKSYDLKLQVEPYLTSNLPLLATLFGGPVAGVVTLAADAVVNPLVGHIAKKDYRLKGSWKHSHYLSLPKPRGDGTT